MSQAADKQKVRQGYVKPYRTKFSRSLDEQIAPVLQAIRESYDVRTVLDQVNVLIKPDPVEAVYKQCYPEVGGEAAMLNVEQINRQIREQKALRTKDEIEDLWAFYLLNYIETVGMSRIVSVTETSRKYAIRAIQEAIDNALENGLSPYEAQIQIEDSVKQQWRKIGVFRADRIARTEVYTAYSLADFESAQSYQIPLKKVWVHGFIGKQDRPGHVQLSGVSVDRDALFTNPMTGAQLMYPHDFNAGAGEVVNCKCSLTYERA